MDKNIPFEKLLSCFTIFPRKCIEQIFFGMMKFERKAVKCQKNIGYKFYEEFPRMKRKTGLQMVHRLIFYQPGIICIMPLKRRPERQTFLS